MMHQKYNKIVQLQKDKVTVLKDEEPAMRNVL
jgi:hypothetical protein